MERKTKSPARTAAFVGIMAATLECGKLVLAVLPNIEVVTLLCALYGYVFGLLGVLSALIFVSIEPIIYGFGTWVISYYLYWPLVSLVFMLFGHLRVKNRWIITAAAVLLTAWFGVLSSLVDIGLLSGFYEDFFKRFAVYYTRGAPFYIIQIICNAALFSLIFNFSADKLKKIKLKFT